MRYEWNEAKAAANFVKHGIAFEDVKDFMWESAVVFIDSRKDYVEFRWIAISSLKDRLHVLVYTWRGDRIRILSLRKANNREFRSYQNAQE